MILKLKQTPGIYLVGFMGCGKTTIGKKLAERVGWPFVDIDQDIETQQGLSISEIFDTLGEAEFRRIEHEAIVNRVRDVMKGKPVVIALGGGAFAQMNNRELLDHHGATIWLDCPFATLEQRVAAATHRPLARDAKMFADLYEQRREHYGRAAYRVEIASDDPDATVETILRLPLFIR